MENLEIPSVLLMELRRLVGPIIGYEDSIQALDKRQKRQQIRQQANFLLFLVGQKELTSYKQLNSNS